MTSIFPTPHSVTQKISSQARSEINSVKYYHAESGLPEPRESFLLRSPVLPVIPEITDELRINHPRQRLFPITADGENRTKDTQSLRIAQLVHEKKRNNQSEDEILQDLTSIYPVYRRDLNDDAPKYDFSEADQYLIKKLKSSHPLITQKAQDYVKSGSPLAFRNSLGEFAKHDVRKPATGMTKRLMGRLHLVLNIMHYLTGAERKDYVNYISRTQRNGSYVGVGYAEIDKFYDGHYETAYPYRLDLVFRRAGYVPDVHFNKLIKTNLQYPEQEGKLPIDERHPQALPRFVYRKDTKQAAKEMKILKEQAAIRIQRVWKRKRPGKSPVEASSGKTSNAFMHC